MKNNIFLPLICAILIVTMFPGCSEDYLDVFPEHQITDAIFWEDESDFEMAVSGLYSILQARQTYAFGGALDGKSPNAFQWNGTDLRIGNGNISPGMGGIQRTRWILCYRWISRANFILANIDDVELNEEFKTNVKGQAHFFKGVAYAMIADTYGGGPIIPMDINVEKAREIPRASVDETWAQAIAHYDIAIQNLPITASQIGRATKGAALGMKARALLYQGKYWEDLIETVDRIDNLNKYSLFPSYEGLFQLENENNEEVLFDIQYISGGRGQGDRWHQHYQPPNLAFPSRGYVAPTQQLVDAYEMIDGSEVDPNNPYEGRDPRLEFTVIVPGSYWSGYLYPDEVSSHVGQRVEYCARKFTIEQQPPIYETVDLGEGPLNIIILRYADILLSKAEALIELNQIDEGITILNRIRTERDDVTMYEIPLGLSQDDARERLQLERRVELAMEGLYWKDFRRWELGWEVCPIELRDGAGGLIETRFPDGWHERYRYLPIPDSEIGLNPNLNQNPGW